MVEQKLPAQFAALEPFLDWALATERERTARRQAIGMAAIREFYAAMLPRLDEILKYLEGFAPEERGAGASASRGQNHVPADVNRLFLLTLSLAEVAPAVENFGQPGVIDGYDFKRFIPIHD